MTFEAPEEMVIIASRINMHVYIELLENFLIPSSENLCNYEIIFQNDEGILSLGQKIFHD